MGIDMGNMGVSTGVMEASTITPPTPTWKDQVMTQNFVGTAVAAPTVDEIDPRQDYLDSMDVIFPMHKEYMPIITQFRCFEDAAGKISGFEIDYSIKPVSETMLGDPEPWKTVGRMGSSTTATTKMVDVSETDYIKEV